MKNGLILDLNAMFSGSKYTTLSSDESYKVFQNSRHIANAAKDIREAIQELIKTDEPEQNDKGGVVMESDKSKVFVEHYKALLEDETEVTLKKMHWEGFNAFCKENSLVSADINALADVLLMEEELDKD